MKVMLTAGAALWHSPMLFAADTPAGAGAATVVQEVNRIAQPAGEGGNAPGQAKPEVKKVEKPTSMAMIPAEELPEGGGLPAEINRTLITPTGRLLPFTQFVEPRLKQAGIPSNEEIETMPHTTPEEVEKRNKLIARKKEIVTAARFEHNALQEKFNTAGKGKVLELLGKGDIKLAGLKPRMLKNGTETYSVQLKRSPKSLAQRMKELEAERDKLAKQLEEERGRKTAIPVESRRVE